MTAPPSGARRWRDENTGIFDATILTAADGLGVQPLAVEKDYWVCQALRAITGAYPSNVVFKGGTSLEKLRIIQRFSEDLDLLVIGDLGNDKAVQKALKDMIAVAAQATGGDPVDAISGGLTGAYHRRAYVEPPLKNESADGLADTTAVLVELGQAGGPNPSSVHAVESLLARALSQADTGITLGEWEDLAPFEVTILHPGRTLIEKLLRVNNFASRPADQDKIHGWARIGRQFYDIWALLGHDDVRSLLADKQTVRDIMSSIIEVSARYTADDPIPEGGFANSPSFDPDGALATGLRLEHDSAMTNLYYGDAALAPSFDDVIGKIRDSAALLDL